MGLFFKSNIDSIKEFVRGFGLSDQEVESEIRLLFTSFLSKNMVPLSGVEFGINEAITKIDKRSSELFINEFDYPKMWCWVHPDNEITLKPKVSSKLPIASESWPIENQEKTNSCVGIAIADGLFNFYVNFQIWSQNKESEKWHAFLNDANDQRITQIPIEKKYSARFVWMMGKECQMNSQPCSTGDDEKGTDLYIALRAIFEFKQIALEHELPLKMTLSKLFSLGSHKNPDPIDGSCPFEFNSMSSLFSKASNNFLNSGVLHYYALYWPDQKDSSFDFAFDISKKWLSLFGPLILELEIGREFMSLYKCSKLKLEDTILSQEVFGKSTDLIDGEKTDEYFQNYSKRFFHAVTAVGFYKNDLDDYLVIKNSWGIEWGYKGYALLSKEYLRQKQISPTNSDHYGKVERRVLSRIMTIST